LQLHLPRSHRSLCTHPNLPPFVVEQTSRLFLGKVLLSSLPPDKQKYRPPPPPTPTNQYGAIIYDATDHNNALAQLKTTFRVTNKNLYSMIELVCVFSRSFFLTDTENRVIQADEGALAAGNYFIVTMGRLPCFLVGHCLLQNRFRSSSPRFTLSKSSPPSSPVFPTVRGDRQEPRTGRDGSLQSVRGSLSAGRRALQGETF